MWWKEYKIRNIKKGKNFMTIKSILTLKLSQFETELWFKRFESKLNSLRLNCCLKLFKTKMWFESELKFKTD